MVRGVCVCVFTLSGVAVEVACKCWRVIFSDFLFLGLF